MWSQVLPFLVGLTFFVVVTFIIQVGNKNNTWNPTGDGKAIWYVLVHSNKSALKQKLVSMQDVFDECLRCRSLKLYMF